VKYIREISIPVADNIFGFLNGGRIMYKGHILWISFVVLFSMVRVCPAQVDPGAKIYWVADDMGGGDTDQGFIDLLTNAGYTVDMSFSNQELRILDGTDLELLNRADLIIISRDSDSRQYDDGDEEKANWNRKIARPILNLNAFYMQANRWNWVPASDTWHYGAGPMRVLEPNHPIMEGITVVDGLVDVVTTQTTFPEGAKGAAGGTLIGVREDNGYVWLASWDTIQTISMGYPPAGPRVLFCCGVDEATTDKQPALPGNGAYNLTEEGSKIFLNAVKYLLEYTLEKAAIPSPEDGAVLSAVSVELSWAPADGTISDNVYFGDNLEAVTNATPASPEFRGNQVEVHHTVEGLIPGDYYYWRIDGVRGDDPDHPLRGDVWSFLIAPLAAYDPSPVDDARLITLDPVLTWRVGVNTQSHVVYFGTRAEAVANANPTSPEYKSLLPPDTTTWQPVADGQVILVPDTRYFWRVDEESTNGTQKGEVWSFETTHLGMGTCTLEVWTGIQSRTVDDLRTDPRFPDSPTEVNELTLFDSNANLGDWNGARIKAWLHVPFTGTYAFKLCSYSPAELWLSTTPGDRTQRQLIVEVPIERLLRNDWRYSSEPIALEANQRYYIEALWVTTDNNGSGSHCQAAWEGPGIRHIEVIQGGYLEPFEELWASCLSPISGTIEVKPNPILSWKAGSKAAWHDVYFGDDQAAVANAITTTPEIYRGRQSLENTIYVPIEAPLVPNKTYYWRIDEINETNPESPWKGNVWNFTTADYIVVDDFESYNDIEAGQEGSHLVYETWVDGFGTTTNGSTIGYTVAFQPSMETSTVYEGKQSVPLFYNNTVASVSEVTANVADLQAGLDWTKYGIRGLTLRFFGDPNNAAQQMYVEVNGAKVIYDAGAENLKRAGWQMWYIDLTSLSANLSNVTTLTIGFERIDTAGGQGMILLDGIRLYSYDRQLITPVGPGTTGLQAEYQFEGNANDSSGKGHNGTLQGDPLFVAGEVGQAISLDGVDDYVNVDDYKGILDGGAFSITAWIKSTSTGDNTIVCWGSSTNGQRVDFRLGSGRLRVEHGNGNLQGHSVVADGQWHHVALTVAENASISYPAVKLYLDGNDDSQTTTDPDVFNIVASVDVNIGHRGTHNDRSCQGLIDEVRIYDRELTQEEVASLAGRTKPFDKPF
jgi:hypothetical protein